ncbi:DNA repair protein RadC (plasmid) [Shewanella sp. LC6]|uniref:RadC family protein n=1 Tax=Shewanella TaxID=22 RepID=UPI000B49E068|nr:MULTISPECIES: DNA repair protein RadC [unclassified Shewanella]QQK62481.1 DNA repair protein RadC [Shewanella sp. LC6]TPE56191.1 DNA repair protein RadC [Shewanella sp. LC2]
MFSVEEQRILAQAAEIIRSKLIYTPVFTNPDLAREFLQNQLVAREHEVFAMLLLDSQHRLIQFVELFRGTIDSASVYPREVVKIVLQYNAAAVIFAHNHPSGISEPSQSDRRITGRLTQALTTIDVATLDHFVVGRDSVTSFAERGWL